MTEIPHICILFEWDCLWVCTALKAFPFFFFSVWAIWMKSPLSQWNELFGLKAMRQQLHNSVKQMFSFPQILLTFQKGEVLCAGRTQNTFSTNINAWLTKCTQINVPPSANSDGHWRLLLWEHSEILCKICIFDCFLIKVCYYRLLITQCCIENISYWLVLLLSYSMHF